MENDIGYYLKLVNENLNEAIAAHGVPYTNTRDLLIDAASRHLGLSEFQVFDTEGFEIRISPYAYQYIKEIDTKVITGARKV